MFSKANSCNIILFLAHSIITKMIFAHFKALNVIDVDPEHCHAFCQTMGTYVDYYENIEKRHRTFFLEYLTKI